MDTTLVIDRPRVAATPVPAPILRLAGVCRRFGTLAALDNVSLSVDRGEIVGIIGRSGAGKSTLIRCLNGLERPDAGRVEIEGRDIAGLDERALQPVRQRIGMIFQHFNLLSARTVAENVALPLKIAGVPAARRRQRAAELLDLVGLADRGQAWPATLSGGQKQRVGIARALAADPALLLSDEATSALDPETTLSILALLRDINRRLGLTIVLITHEMSVVRAVADRVVVLDRGRIVEHGPVWQVFATPRNEVTRSLLHAFRPDLPAAMMAALRPGPGPDGGVLLRLDLSGDRARRPLLAELQAELGLAAVLVQARLDQLQGEPVGTLFLRTTIGGPDELDRLRAFLTARVDHLEVLGHVPDAV